MPGAMLPTFFLTYGETELLLAEAAQRGWISGVLAALLLYQWGKGRHGSDGTGSFKVAQDPATTDINGYWAANPLTAGSELKLINTQYWVASFMDETESWANWRRSGFPVLTPVNLLKCHRGHHPAPVCLLHG